MSCLTIDYGVLKKVRVLFGNPDGLISCYVLFNAIKLFILLTIFATVVRLGNDLLSSVCFFNTMIFPSRLHYSHSSGYFVAYLLKPEVFSP